MDPLDMAEAELARAEQDYQIECARFHASYPTKLYRAQARLYAARERLAALMGGER